jgi:hypothetical protein
MPLPLVTIGVFITTALLVFAVFTISNDHPMRIQTRLETISSSLHQRILTVDNAFYEQQSVYTFPAFFKDASVHLTAHSILIKEKKNNAEYRCTKTSVTPWWVQTKHTCWTNTSTFHQYLNQTYGHDGTIHDPLPFSDDIKDEINTLYTNSQQSISISPVKIDVTEPLFIEKCIIFYDSADISYDNRQSFLFIYQ